VGPQKKPLGIPSSSDHWLQLVRSELPISRDAMAVGSGVFLLSVLIHNKPCTLIPLPILLTLPLIRLRIKRVRTIWVVCLKNVVKNIREKVKTAKNVLESNFFSDCI